VTAPASCDTGLRKFISTTPQPSRPAAWWTRDFRGTRDQVVEVRHWLEDLLPDCGPRADVLLLASELSTNAVVHSRSGEPGGQFSVDVDWTPTLVRVIVGDQGSDKAPAVAAKAGSAPPLGESGRGLLLVDELANAWGTASPLKHRWVWADIPWQARGGPSLDDPCGMDAAIADITVVRKAFPGTSIWWGHLTKAWWAAIPGAASAIGLIRSQTRDGLLQALASAYPNAAIPCGGRHMS